MVAEGSANDLKMKSPPVETEGLPKTDCLYFL